MKFSSIVYFLLFSFLVMICCVGNFSCAQIGNPTGGPKDTLAPRLVNAHPDMYTTEFTGNTITMSFNEYINLKDIQTNLLVSPYPKKNPTIYFKNKTVTIKLRDTLKDNTTYAINFGNAVVDVHEGNAYKNLTYVFSTGKTIDSLKIVGSVTLAETGKIDSTILILLYPEDAPDSAVQKFKPQYVTRLRKGGKFVFTNLPNRKFRIFALGDADGSKTYDALTETFAFIDSAVQPSLSIANPVDFFAYAAQRPKPAVVAADKSKNKKFKFTTTLANAQDLLSNIEIDFNSPLKEFDQNKIILTDTFYNKVAYGLVIDSTRKIVTLKHPWKPDEAYKLIIIKDGFSDTLGNFLNKTDTITFKTKKQSDYGTLSLRFPNIDLSKHPVIEFLQNDAIVRSAPIRSEEWDADLFAPGEYDMRILYDTNNNGVWDPGDFFKRIQPEKVISFEKKLKIKADWDNESEIRL